MKNKLKFLGTLSVMLVAAYACDKATKEPIVNSNANNNQEPQVTYAGKLRPNAYWKKGMGLCNSDMYKNCYAFTEPVVVTPHATNRIIQQCETGDINDIADAFSNDPDFVVFGENIDEDNIAKLKTGELYLGIIFQNDEFITIYSGPEYPVTDSNYEFVFQYRK